MSVTAEAIAALDRSVVADPVTAMFRKSLRVFISSPSLLNPDAMTKPDPITAEAIGLPERFELCQRFTHS
jgi:hypothetical protein